MNLDKERYAIELRELTRCNKTLDKPKKPLTPYMLFVRDVSASIFILVNNCEKFEFRRDPKLSRITQTFPPLTLGRRSVEFGKISQKKSWTISKKSQEETWSGIGKSMNALSTKLMT